MTVQKNCVPRGDIISGVFNPDIFTASLAAVFDFYAGKPTAASSLYTDAIEFFEKATYPTEGMKQVISEVFGRLSGDNACSAVHRLETGFGGGKTHTLIALTHISKRGKELTGKTSALVDDDVLPDPNSIEVVGVAGDELPIQEVSGSKIQPYTLWGEIAYQLGGESLYNQLKSEATSFSAPGSSYLETVFSGRKVLIMLDEMAQYASRLEAARTNGSEQLQAFLMSLLNYAQNNSHLSVVITLSATADAFSRQLGVIKDMLAKVTGKDVSDSEAEAYVDKAVQGTNSVVARAAVTVVPVMASELSRLLARRLFESISEQAAEDVAQAYLKAYKSSAQFLPAYCGTSEYAEKLKAYYPFHPTFIDFLNNKLASVENFQGTRGVLRMLSLVIRSLWQKQNAVHLIHTGDIDLKDQKILNELLGRTGSGNLQVVVNTDVGGPNTSELDSGYSRAELQDNANPHPSKIKMYQMTWRTVFLHSLAGRSDGLASNLFGIASQDAHLSLVMPEMSGAQVEIALNSIKEEAYYLRERNGRYFASLDPSVNRALGDIRSGVSHAKALELVMSQARSSIKDGSGMFKVVSDVYESSHIPDSAEKPLLCVVSLEQQSIDVESLITTNGLHPRKNQNLVFVLLPQTTKASQDATWKEDKLNRINQNKDKLIGIAKQVIAMRLLQEKPDAYGLNEKHLESDNFKPTKAEREKALETETVRMYDSIWYPSASGSVTKKDVKTSSGESGSGLMNKIREILKTDGELITDEVATTKEMLAQLNALFFDSADNIKISSIRSNFSQRRVWPILEKNELLDKIIRTGSETNHWCVYKMGAGEKPEAFYSREKGPIPFTDDLSKDGWGLVTESGAKKRGWLGNELDPVKVKEWVSEALANNSGVVTIADVTKNIAEKHGTITNQDVVAAAQSLYKDDKVAFYSGAASATTTPSDLKTSQSDLFAQISPDQTLVSKQAAIEKGWIVPQAVQAFKVDGVLSKAKLVPMIKQLGSLYLTGGATSTVDSLDILNIELPNGGSMGVRIQNANKDDMKALQEMFETLMSVGHAGASTDARLTIKSPEDGCALVSKFKGS